MGPRRGQDSIPGRRAARHVQSMRRVHLQQRCLRCVTYPTDAHVAHTSPPTQGADKAPPCKAEITRPKIYNCGAGEFKNQLQRDIYKRCYLWAVKYGN